MNASGAYDFTLHYLIHPAIRGEYLIPLVLRAEKSSRAHSATQQD